MFIVDEEHKLWKTTPWGALSFNAIWTWLEYLYSISPALYRRWHTEPQIINIYAHLVSLLYRCEKVGVHLDQAPSNLRIDVYCYSIKNLSRWHWWATFRYHKQQDSYVLLYALSLSCSFHISVSLAWSLNVRDSSLCCLLDCLVSLYFLSSFPYPRLLCCDTDSN